MIHNKFLAILPFSQKFNKLLFLNVHHITKTNKITKALQALWCTTRKPKGSSYTRSLTKLFERISYCSINNIGSFMAVHLIYNVIPKTKFNGFYRDIEKAIIDFLPQMFYVENNIL